MLHYFGHDTWLKAAVFKLRYEVFVLEQGILPKNEFDDETANFDYFLVVDKDKNPIATIRYQNSDKKTINPDRFCVAKNFRNQGIGRTLLAKYERKAQNDGYLRSELSAEVSAISFYEKSGYQVISDSYLEDGILCARMEKNLKRS